MMNRLFFALAVSFLMAFPSMAGAAGSTLQWGLGYQHFDYKEDLPAPFKSTEKGWLPSIYASYEFKKKSFLYGKVHTDFASANVTYDGTTQGGTPVTFDDHNRQNLFKYEMQIGYAFALRDNLLLIPYAGYGLRFWERGQSKITSAYRSYVEDYFWNYIPVGVKVDYTVNEKWSVGGSLAAHFMFGGKMKAYVSEVQPVVNDQKFDLGNEIGYYIDVPVTFRITPRWSVVATPWYEYSAIGKSNTVNVTYNNTLTGYAYEPASRTHQYGIRLGAAFTF